MNIVEIAAGSDDFNILVQALTTAELVTTIQDSTDITVFAPTDAAFATLATDLGFTGDTTDETAVFNFIAGTLASLDPDGDPIPLLSEILTYHVAGSVLDAAAVTSAASISTLSTGNAIVPDVPVLQDLEPDLINPSLIDTDITADNGILHVIDRVLLPLDIPGNDVPSITGLVAASGDGPDDDNTDFDLLLAAVQTALLADVLDTDGLDATVFAPTDAAFIALAQDLGFTGSDEAGALTAIVDTLTALGGGNPLPLLSGILLYHVSAGAKQLSQVAGLTEVETLQGGTFGVSGTFLVDNEPDLADPALIATDIQTSNGIVHAIDRVLLPVDIPASNGAGGQVILFGDPINGGRISGGADNDLLFGATALDDLRGNAGGDLFAMLDDGVRDIIRDFEIGVDQIDVSAFADSIDDLTISNLVRANGTTSWISVADQAGDAEFILRFGDGTTLDAANLTADSFVFSDTEIPAPAPNIVQGTTELDNLRGTVGADIYALLDDGVRDLVRDFDSGVDAIDVSAFATMFEDLEITNLVRRDGSVSWINVADASGDAEFILRFGDDTPLDAANLTAEDFVFGPGIVG
ncbi:MAG: fasciclin domain-containing protein [Pseudomonadota bacterium]